MPVLCILPRKKKITPWKTNPVGRIHPGSKVSKKPSALMETVDDTDLRPAAN